MGSHRGQSSLLCWYKELNLGRPDRIQALEQLPVVKSSSSCCPSPCCSSPSEEALVEESQGQLLRPVFLLAVKTDFTSFGRNLLSWVKMAVVASSSKSGKGKFEYCRGHLCLNLLLMRLLPGFIQFHIPFMYFMKHNFSNNCLTKYRCLWCWLIIFINLGLTLSVPSDTPTN